MQYYENEKGEIAIMVSPGYGAGWSTWSSYGVDLATDKRIVEKFLSLDEKTLRRISSFVMSDEKEEFKKFLENCGYFDVFMGGLCQVQIIFVPKGSAIKITEYDGFESLDVDYTGYTIVG